MCVCVQIAQVLTDKDISVIFAVDSKMHALYSSLAEFLPSAAVGILSDSSTNIVQLLLDNYNKIVNKAELLMTHDMNDLEVSVCVPISRLLSVVVVTQCWTLRLHVCVSVCVFRWRSTPSVTSRASSPRKRSAVSILSGV